MESPGFAHPHARGWRDPALGDGGQEGVSSQAAVLESTEVAALLADLGWDAGPPLAMPLLLLPPFAPLVGIGSQALQAGKEELGPLPA